MLPSALIKVKSRDVTGREGDAGDSPRHHPLPAPPLHKSAAGGRAAAPAATPGREERRTAELEDVRPRAYTQTPPKDVHPQNTPKDVTPVGHLTTRTPQLRDLARAKGAGAAGNDGKLL